MSGIGKTFIVLNLVFSLVIVGAAAVYLAETDNFKEKYDAQVKLHDEATEEWKLEKNDFEASVKNLNDDNGVKQRKIEDLGIRTSDLESQLNSEKVSSQQLRDDVTKINNKLGDLQSTINDLTSRNNDLADQNATLRNEKLDAVENERKAIEDKARLEGEVARLQETINGLEERITEAEKEKEDLTNKLETARASGFDISKIVAHPEISAYVEAVDAEKEFVILSVGSDDKVKKGYVFTIYREDTYLGEVQVNDLYPDHCAACFKVQAPGTEFKVNDKATTVL